jgi:hypothetical protein
VLHHSHTSPSVSLCSLLSAVSPEILSSPHATVWRQGLTTCMEGYVDKR